MSHTACHEQSHAAIHRNFVTKTRCTHLNSDSCREYQNFKNAGGSVVEPIEAKSPVVSNHHINILPFHVFLASHESRHTVCQNQDALRCALGRPQLLRTMRGSNHPSARAAYSAKQSVDPAVQTPRFRTHAVAERKRYFWFCYINRSCSISSRLLNARLRAKHIR